MHQGTYADSAYRLRTRFSGRSMVGLPVISNLERAWEITGRSEDELTGVMLQISQAVEKQFKAED